MFDRALRMVRQYHRLTQSDLATKIGLSKSYVNEIERGRKEPSLDVLQKYAEFFDIPLSSLMLFAEKADSSGIERARVFAADKVLKMLEWISDDHNESAHRKADSKRTRSA